MRWGLLINPTSGGGRGEKVGIQVRQWLDRNQIEIIDLSGSSYESAQSNLRQQNLSDLHGVIAVGGDGLVHCVIQQLAKSSTPLAVVPGGTGNDFARALGLPLDQPEKILTKVMNSPAVPIDLGKVGDQYFAAILSTGFDSVVNERANRMRRIKGRLKYNISILLELPLFQPRQYQFRIDGEGFTTEAMLIAIGNGSSYGGGMLVCPGANLHDGSFEVMILQPVSKMEFLRVFPKVFSGAHINHPKVKILHGSSIEMESDAVAYADGERIGPLPIQATTIADALLTWKF